MPREALPVGWHVKLVVAAVSAIVATMGLRDVFAPGAPLPFPGDDLLMPARWGEPPLPSAQLLTVQFTGILLVAVAGIKAFAVFTNPEEGTVVIVVEEGRFLRNLFLVFSAIDFAIAALWYAHEPTLKASGASGVPFAAMLAIEGLVFAADAAYRTYLKMAGDGKDMH